MGRSAKGVKAIDLSADDFVLAGFSEADSGELVLVSDKGYGKRIMGINFSPQNRGGKGLKTFHFNANGSNGTKLVSAISISQPENIIIHQKSGEVKNIPSDEFHVETTKGTGKPVVIPVLGDEITKVYMHLK